MILGLDSAPKHLEKQVTKYSTFGGQTCAQRTGSGLKKASWKCMEFSATQQKGSKVESTCCIRAFDNCTIGNALCGESENRFRRERLEVKITQCQVSLCRVLDLKRIWQREHDDLL